MNYKLPHTRSNCIVKLWSSCSNLPCSLGEVFSTFYSLLKQSQYCYTWPCCYNWHESLFHFAPPPPCTCKGHPCPLPPSLLLPVGEHSIQRITNTTVSWFNFDKQRPCWDTLAQYTFPLTTLYALYGRQSLPIYLYSWKELMRHSTEF